MVSRRVVVLALILCILAPAAHCADTVAALNAIIKPVQLEWRYKQGDIPNAQDPALDDSAWKVDKSNGEFTWGDQPAAWLRTTVVIPEKISGISIAGSKVTLKIGIDDSGVLYVNGKEAGPFDWDRGSFVISDSAVPGDRLSIAIKCINTGGPGRLLLANLGFSALDDVRAAAASLLDAYNGARALQNAAASSHSAQIARALNEVDTTALESGDKPAFLASAKTGEAQLREISAEISRGLTISLLGHAHIDLAWLWTYPETVQVCKNTFTTACDLMDQYPLIFAQSQVATYDEMKRSYPDLYARIKERVKRGQWDVSTAMMWSEGDTNMSSGEGIVRSMLLANRFIKREFGVEPTVGWLPDNFGHTWQLPQIFAKRRRQVDLLHALRHRQARVLVASTGRLSHPRLQLPRLQRRHRRQRHRRRRDWLRTADRHPRLDEAVRPAATTAAARPARCSKRPPRCRSAPTTPRSSSLRRWTTSTASSSPAAPSPSIQASSTPSSRAATPRTPTSSAATATPRTRSPPPRRSRPSRWPTASITRPRSSIGRGRRPASTSSTISSAAAASTPSMTTPRRTTTRP